MKPTITVTDRAVQIETDQYLLTLQMRAGSFNVNDRTGLGITPHKDAKHPVSKPDKKKAATTDKKTCIKCGKPFTPRSNVQKYCSKSCGMKPNKGWKKNKLNPNKEAELNATLKEIEDRRKQPYEFVNQL